MWISFGVLVSVLVLWEQICVGGAPCLGNYDIPVDFSLLSDMSFVQFNARIEERVTKRETREREMT